MNDPTLQEALEYYVDLECMDINIDVIQGIDDMQVGIAKLYQQITDGLLEKVFELESKEHDVGKELLLMLTSRVKSLEDHITQIYDVIVFQPDVSLQIIEDRIKEIEEENGTEQVASITKKIETAPPVDRESEIVYRGAKADSNERVNDGPLGSEIAALLSRILVSPIILSISLEPSQLDAIVLAIKGIKLEISNHPVSVDRAENVVCDTEGEPDLKYELTTCYRDDLANFAVRNNVAELTEFLNKPFPNQTARE